MNSYRVDFEAMDWTVPGAGVRYKVFRQGARQVRLVEFTREFVESDWCEKGHVGYVLEGELSVRFERETVVLKAGDGVFIPAGREHRHMASVLSKVARLVLVEE